MKKGGRGTRKERLLVEFQALSARNSYIRHLIETAEKKVKEKEGKSSERKAAEKDLSGIPAE